jgi:hypothetical protein
LVFHLQKYYDHDSEPGLVAEMEVDPTKTVEAYTNPGMDVKNDEFYLKMPTAEQIEKKIEKLKPRKKMQHIKAFDFAAPTNIPLEIICYLFSYVAHVSEERLGESFCINSLNGCTLKLKYTIRK